MFRKRYGINELKDGQFIDDIFVVKIKKTMSRYRDGYYFNLLLSDNSGKTIDYTYWGPNDEAKVKLIYNSIKNDSIVHVQGKVSIYKNKLRITTNEPNIIEVLKEGQYREEDFIKPARRDIEEMYNALKKTIDCVENKDIKTLLNNIFYDKEIENKFKRHPGSIEIHHNWIGGLLQHTLEVLDYCMLSKKHFPGLDSDLLIAGSLLHDIGKIEELEMTTRIKGTEKGQLIGHLPIGMMFVSKKIDEINGFDNDLKNKILHMIVSHHGKLEYGAPKEPMFPEALAVYYADEISAKMAEITEFIKNSKDDTEDSFMYSKRNGKNIFLR
ncbi:MAG: HD domain-containing protein [Candidatus Woesearchaeota archaeon]|nr:HD domain-containing protein [Candidatus Woesearchaeota archaeon]